MNTPFLEAIRKKVLLCDGAMGTLLYEKGVFISRCFDELNLSNPQLIQDAHRSYIHCGVDILQTNTFGANRIKLTGFGLAERTSAINIAGAQLARSCAGNATYVAGSIGPLGVRIEPWGKIRLAEAKEIFKEQVLALLEGGVDFFMLETFYDLNEICAAIQAVRETSSIPVVAQMTLEDDGNSLEGTPPEVFGKRIDEFGADVVGLNCSVGPQIMLESLERIAAVTEKPLSAQPNAGKPKNVEGRNIYLSSPEYMASYAKRFVRTGARIVGGCCGTSPDHIGAMARVLLELDQASQSTQRTLQMVTAESRNPTPPVLSKNKSRLAGKLLQGQFIVSAEIMPPKGLDWSEAKDIAKQFKSRGVDVVNIPEGVRAGAPMSSHALAVLLERETGMETVLQYSCRDKSLLAMQSDVLGLHALGLRNLLLITGDPQKSASYLDATVVYDVDSIGFANMVNYLNHGLDLGGDSIGEPCAFFIGVSANPSAINLDEEVRRFEHKVDAGAEYCVTQPVFDVGALEQFMKRIQNHRIPVIAGIWPLDSYRTAEFLNNELPDVVIPKEVIERMRHADSMGRARAEGIIIAREQALCMKPLIQGLHFITASLRYAYTVEIMELMESFTAQA